MYKEKHPSRTRTNNLHVIKWHNVNNNSQTTTTFPQNNNNSTYKTATATPLSTPASSPCGTKYHTYSSIFFANFRSSSSRRWRSAIVSGKGSGIASGSWAFALAIAYGRRPSIAPAATPTPPPARGTIIMRMVAASTGTTRIWRTETDVPAAAEQEPEMVTEPTWPRTHRARFTTAPRATRYASQRTHCPSRSALRLLLQSPHNLQKTPCYCCYHTLRKNNAAAAAKSSQAFSRAPRDTKPQKLKE